MARASPGEALAEDDEDVDDVVVPTALAMRTGAMTVTGRVVAVAMVAVEDRSVPTTCQPLPSALGVQRGSGNLRSVSRCSRERAWPESSAGQCEGSGAAQGVRAAEKGTGLARASLPRARGWPARLPRSPTPHARPLWGGGGAWGSCGSRLGRSPRRSFCAGRGPLSRCARPSASTARGGTARPASPGASKVAGAWRGPGGPGPSPVPTPSPGHRPAGRRDRHSARRPCRAFPASVADFFGRQVARMHDTPL